MIEERLDWGVIRCWKMASLCRRVYCGDSAGASIRKGRQSWKKAGKKLEESWKKAGRKLGQVDTCAQRKMPL